MNAAKLFSLILVSSFGILVAFSLSDFTTTNYLSIGVSAGLLAIVCLAPAVYYLKHDPPRIVSPISLQGLSFFLFGVLGTGYALLDTSSLVMGEAGLRFFPFATFLLTLGFLSFFLGYFLVPSWTGNRVAVSQWKQDRIWTVILVLVVAVWGIRAYLAIQGYVGTKLIVASPITYVGNPILLALLLRSHMLSALAINICVIAYARVYVDRPAIRKKWQQRALILLIVETLYYAIIQLTRYQILGPWLGVFCILCLTRRPPWRQLLIFVVLFLAVLTPVVHSARSILTEQRLLETEPTGIGKLRMLIFDVFPAAIEGLVENHSGASQGALGHAAHYSTADLMAAMVERQEEQGTPPMGWDLILSPLFLLVPRVIWKDKPPGFEMAEAIKGYYGFWDERDAVVGTITEFYAAFGMLGIIIGMAAFGIFLRLVYRTLVEKDRGNWNTGIVLYGTISMDLMFSQGDISSALASVRDLILLWIFLSITLEGRLPVGKKSMSHVPLAKTRFLTARHTIQ